jgi:ATP-dependent helicase HrpB
MLGGRGVRIADSSAVATAPLFVCVDLDAGGTESIVRLASAVEPQWIPPDWIQTIESRAFDDTTERVVTTRRRVVEGMTLDEVFVNSDDPGADAGALASAARAHIERAAPKDDGDLAGFLARAACARVWLPDLDLPEVALESVLPDLCAGRNSFAALRKAPWLEVIRSKFSRRQLEAIDRELPVEIAVPSGSRIRIQYNPGKPPVLAVRIQELFGLLATPRIARGTVPLLLHLLAPNYRPQQVTADLQSFWKNTYPQVRKELRARYPRHAWPEDPLTATPQRKPRPRS